MSGGTLHRPAGKSRPSDAADGYARRVCVQQSAITRRSLSRSRDPWKTATRAGMLVIPEAQEPDMLYISLHVCSSESSHHFCSPIMGMGRVPDTYVVCRPYACTSAEAHQILPIVARPRTRTSKQFCASICSDALCLSEVTEVDQTARGSDECSLPH